MTDEFASEGESASEAEPPSEGAFTTEVAVRYADVDTYGHVNNAVYATLCEEARIDYVEAVLGEAGRSIDGTDDDASAVGDGVGFVVANLTLDFERPLGRVDAVEVSVRVPRLGEKSFPFEYEIRSPDGIHATGETTVVAFDRERRESRPIPDAWREQIADFEGISVAADRE